MLVTHEWLKEHLDDPNIVILDTRPKIAYSYGHIPHSQSLEVDKVIKINQYGAHLVADQDQIKQVFCKLGIDNTKSVVVCGEYMDPSVTRIAWTLLYLGHQKTNILDFGIGSLQRSGYELTRKPYTANPTDFVPTVNKNLRIETDELKNSLDKITPVDARTIQEYMGGHLPHSILLPFSDSVGVDGRLFRDREYLSKLFEENKITKDKEVVCYCTHGHRASSLFFQLQIAGYEKIRLYDDSFMDWYGRRLPLE